MERSDEETNALEPSYSRFEQAGWSDPESGQAAGQSREPAQGRIDQKSQGAGLLTQRTAAAPRSPQALIAAISVIQSRFGCSVIGLGEAGIRYRGAMRWLASY
jgi:hypothetical protein